MEKPNNKLFAKFEEEIILKTTQNEIIGGGGAISTLNPTDESSATGDTDCTAGGLDCSDGYTTDVFKDAIFTKPDNDGC